MYILVLSQSMGKRDLVEFSKREDVKAIILANGYFNIEVSKDDLEKLRCPVYYISNLYNLESDVISTRNRKSNVQLFNRRYCITLNYLRGSSKKDNFLSELGEPVHNKISHLYETVSSFFKKGKIFKLRNEENKLIHYIIYTYSIGKNSIEVNGNVIKISHLLTSADKIYAEITYNKITIKNKKTDDILDEQLLE